MTFKLPPHVYEKYVAACHERERQVAVFANLDDGDLAASARFWMQHCDAPRRSSPDTVTYDGTFWHVIVPEMIRRMERGVTVGEPADVADRPRVTTVVHRQTTVKLKVSPEELRDIVVAWAKRHHPQFRRRELEIKVLDWASGLPPDGPLLVLGRRESDT